METLLVGLIVLVAVLYSAWALAPAAARRRFARRLLSFADAGACPAWLGRRIRTAAADGAAGSGPCDGCGGSRPGDDVRH